MSRTLRQLHQGCSACRAPCHAAITPWIRASVPSSCDGPCSGAMGRASASTFASVCSTSRQPSRYANSARPAEPVGASALRFSATSGCSLDRSAAACVASPASASARSDTASANPAAHASCPSTADQSVARPAKASSSSACASGSAVRSARSASLTSASGLSMWWTCSGVGRLPSSRNPISRPVSARLSNTDFGHQVAFAPDHSAVSPVASSFASCGVQPGPSRCHAALRAAPCRASDCTRARATGSCA